MLLKTKGLIIHSLKYSESSIIVKIFSREYGLKSYITRSSRGKRTKNKANLFQPLNIVNLVVKHSDKVSLQKISAIEIASPYNNLPYHDEKRFIAIFINEVLHRSLQEEHPDSELYDFIEKSLLILDLTEANYANFHLLFMMQLSRYLGFYPQGSFSSNTPYFDLQEGVFVANEPMHLHFLDNELCDLFNNLLNLNYDNTLRLKRDKRNKLLNSLVLYYQLHITTFKEIKSKTILQEIID